MLTALADSGDDLVRQPRDGFSTIRFGPGTFGNVGELDQFCKVPKVAYALCVADMSVAAPCHARLARI
jgi:hypothetical protein